MKSTVKGLSYVIAGLLIGGFWYLNRGRPLWEEVLRTVILFSILATVLRFRVRRRGVDVHLIPLIATKAVLVVITAVVEDVLRHHSTAHSSLIAAVGLGLAVCLAGAIGDSHFFSRFADSPGSG